MRKIIENFCTKIGSNPLLFQGAGGNISWKEGHILWVKASGTWLSKACEGDIFVPVNLDHLIGEISNNRFHVTPKIIGRCTLKPSIETLLHAVMSHQIVVHFHPVEVLSFLLREQCNLKDMVGNTFPFAIVDYYKPGEPLARAVYREINNNPSAYVVFMKNHGVTIGGNNIEEIEHTLTILQEIFSRPSRKQVKIPSLEKEISLYGRKYYAIKDSDIQQLVFDKELFERLSPDWALYPDHVVFLGARPCILNRQLDNRDRYLENPPTTVFVDKRGVFASSDFKDAQMEQLRCYYNILSRQEPGIRLSSLTVHNVEELLKWDAEKYRQGVSQ